MKKHYPLWLLSLGVVIWITVCMSVLVLGALAGLSPKTLQPVKSLNALGIWVWIYLMTSPVARWRDAVAGRGSCWGS